MGIDPEERPARKPGVGAAFEPRHRLVRFPEYRINAGDVVVGVVRVAEGTRGIQRLTNTLRVRGRFDGAGRAACLEWLTIKGSSGSLFQSRRQPLLGELQVSAQQRRE